MINLSIQNFTHFLVPYMIALKTEKDQRKGGGSCDWAGPYKGFPGQIPTILPSTALFVENL